MGAHRAKARATAKKVVKYFMELLLAISS